MVEQYALVSDTELRTEIWGTSYGTTHVRCSECKGVLQVFDHNGISDMTMTLGEVLATLRDHVCNGDHS